MKSKRAYMIIVFSFLFILGIFSGINQVQAASSFDDKGIKSGIDANKEWTVRFNKELDKSTVNESNFTVKDEDGQSVSVNVTIGSDCKSVTISPKKQYIYGKTYELNISNVKSSSGKELTLPAKMKFLTKNDTKNTYTVCIDPGHGGYDTGNVSSSGVKEKDIDLSVALKLGKILESNGVKVVYTRNSDSVSWNKDNELQTRFSIANDAKADYFISIHCNIYPENSDTKGIETYYADSDAVGEKLARAVQSELVSGTDSVDRGAKADSTHDILKGTNGNAIMVELGFMSNADESLVLSTDDFQNKSANAMATGILKSLSLVNKDSDISSIADITSSVEQNAKYDLPLNMTALMSDGSSKEVEVVWSSKADTSSTGTYTYEGTVAGYSKHVKLLLTIGTAPTTPPVVTPNSDTICIDPGHGLGKDTGATGINGLQEDDVTLAVGLKVGKILEDHGVNVVYTRTEDERSTPMSVTDSLQKRCDISNNAGAKYFVCIHANSFDAESANGTETLVNQDNPEAKRLAQAIQNSIVNEVGTYDRGLKDGNWLYIVKNTSAPAVLTELGFLTNPSDAEKLTSDDYRQKFAQAIADGILQCLGK